MALAVALALIIGGIPALIALVVASVAGLALLFIHFFDNIKVFFSKVGNWIGDLFKKIVNSIANYLINTVNLFVKFYNFLLKPISAISKAFGGKEIQIPLIPLLDWGGVGQFANGGMFEGSGTLYKQAGEASAEVVAKGSNGTGVLNISQFRQAMVEALYEYGVMQNGGIDISGKITAVVDGAEIASSTRFRNEANRRNPNLGWA